MAGEARDHTPINTREAVGFLRSCATTIKEIGPVYLEGRKGQIQERDYDDHKSAQLLDFLADLIVAEMMIASWFADIGTRGCTGESCPSSE